MSARLYRGGNVLTFIVDLLRGWCLHRGIGDVATNGETLWLRCILAGHYGFSALSEHGLGVSRFPGNVQWIVGYMSWGSEPEVLRRPIALSMTDCAKWRRRQDRKCRASWLATGPSVLPLTTGPALIVPPRSLELIPLYVSWGTQPEVLRRPAAPSRAIWRNGGVANGRCLLVLLGDS